MSSVDDEIRAIAEPHRRAILRLVWDAELAAGDIAGHFKVSRPAISQHLRVLREAGLIEERRVGTRRLYRARTEKIAELRSFLAAFWDDRLTHLKEEVESHERRTTARRDRDNRRRAGGPNRRTA
jgi:DNA-binding transcriptional ArsR family regulator